ncbi:MAG TPA: valine--tRNA ligase [Kiritimatiellia bacterium]|nr:valine--tRNA ligase [Kiritimatiellia bacterium]
MSDLPKHYDPKVIEAKWYAWWLQQKCFHRDPTHGGEPYTIVIPPPNVTGILHMGHALNNSIQDVLIRWRRMQGYNAVWVPGTDHAGIATQNVVERELKKEGLRRQDLGREKFLERVWAWKDKYGDTIVNQLKALGASCDWDRTRFTMDEGLSNAVKEVFIRLFDKGLIYRGTYIINWCPRCQTALSDEESEHRDVKGKLYHLKYAVKDVPGEFVTVATTRPETFLGDTAVAVNPKDERYLHLVGKTLILPILNREIPVIADDFVAKEFGTGCVKVTPAHDPNDYQMGLRHNLPQINVMTDDGHMNENAGPYQGLERFACRKKIMEDLEAAGLLVKVEEHPHAVGHCYRCSAVVEPRLSPQWFVKMKPLAEPGIKAVREGQIKFVPDRWNKVYLEWMENIRDWCISRQIWWGHQIPIFYCDDCGHQWADRGQPTACPTCASAKIRQDEDVLDTWFSSWLWPFSVFNWPEQNPDLKFYYPTNSLSTASEIIFFWVARMIMAGYEFMGDLPFTEVYIHGTVRDNQGRKMSKSLGNSIDPLEIINEFSADALRFSLLMLTATGQDVYVSKDKFEVGRNFGTKIWNVARFMQMHKLEQPLDVRALKLNPENWSADDWHIVAKVDDAAKAAQECLERFRFNDYAHVLYEFLWHEFCDWYVEYAKEVLYGQDETRRREVLSIMHHVFDRALRLLHPLMPFLTEELWHGMGYGLEGETIMTAPWPKADNLTLRGMAQPYVEYVDLKHDLIRKARQLRADYEVPPGDKVDLVIKPVSAEAAAQLESDAKVISLLVKAGSIKVDPAFEPSQAMPSALNALGSVYLSLGAVDVEAERAKLTGQLEAVTQELERIDARLNNPGFVQKAKLDVVNQARARRDELADKREKLTAMLAGLG